MALAPEFLNAAVRGKNEITDVYYRHVPGLLRRGFIEELEEAKGLFATGEIEVYEERKKGFLKSIERALTGPGISLGNSSGCQMRYLKQERKLGSEQKGKEKEKKTYLRLIPFPGRGRGRRACLRPSALFPSSLSCRLSSGLSRLPQRRWISPASSPSKVRTRHACPCRQRCS